MSDEDPFYEKLPFTISQDQATPEWVILGTGLQECLLAAHFSKMHLKQGLVIDTEKLYGSCLKTITFKELHELYLEKNKEKLYKFFQINSYHEKNLDFYNKLIETKTYRGYNLDIEPNFFFGNSTTC
jgi:RAB protein geranylgeranyltransferase component A